MIGGVSGVVSTVQLIPQSSVHKLFHFSLVDSIHTFSRIVNCYISVLL